VANIIYKLFNKRAQGIINIGTGKGIQIKYFANTLQKKEISIITNSKKKDIIIANTKKLNSFIKL
jgi:hypothetical protein